MKAMNNVIGSGNRSEENKSPDGYEKNYLIDNSTLEEVWKEYDAGFSFYASECRPGRFPGRTYPWHWHEYVQFFYVLDGEICYQLLDGTHIFKKGDGGFINSNALHMITDRSTGNALFIEELLYPSFIGGIAQNDITTRYVQPIVLDTSFPVFRLSKDDPDHLHVLELLREMYSLYMKKEECYELLIHSKISLLWADFYRITKGKRLAIHADAPSTGRLKTMMLYISNHYSERVTLDQIADAGTCSRRECNRTFKAQLDLTPFEYLTQIRLNKAAIMLRSTNLSVTELAENCGFSDSSHFTKAFKTAYGITPRQYRAGS